VHAVVGEHGAHAAVPFAYDPTGHVATVNGQDVAPCALKDPAAQGRHTAEEGAPLAAEYVPAEQGVHVKGAAAPGTLL
jgi:hypothetical protein